MEQLPEAAKARRNHFTHDYRDAGAVAEEVRDNHPCRQRMEQLPRVLRVNPTSSPRRRGPSLSISSRLVAISDLLKLVLLDAHLNFFLSLDPRLRGDDPSECL
jgi:hypothetical protein